MDNNIRGSSIVYQSLSYNMINELLQNAHTPAWIKIWLYFSILQKYNKKIYAKNKYISTKLDIPLGTVKYSITKLRDEGLIEIVNGGTWLRQIKLTKIANINENDNKEIKDRNEYEYHSIYNRLRFKDNVYLTQDEYNALLERVKTESTLDTYITSLDKYLSASVIKYTSHYQMLCIWLDKDEQQVKNKKKKFDTPNYQWFLTIERNYIPPKDTTPIDTNFNWLVDDYDSNEE